MKAAQCMRANGVTSFPDPTMNSRGNATLSGLRGLDRNNPVVAKALKACEKYFAASRSSFSPTRQLAVQNALLAYAQCMRANGYNMPDPTVGGGGLGGFSGSSSINRTDPAYKKANAICRPKLAKALGGAGASVAVERRRPAEVADRQ